MKKLSIVVLALLLLATFSSVSFARDLKLAYVDVFGLFNEYEKTKEYDKALEKRKSLKEKELESEKKKIEKMQNKLSLLKNELFFYPFVYKVLQDDRAVGK